MKNLIKHIEKLLPEHDCVVVPGLGGFVQNEVSARFDSRSDILYPEGKEICFNIKLTFNDGFLAQAYQESLGLSFEESNIQIRQGVQELQYKIDEGKYVSLGQIGVMWKNNQGQLCFRSETRSSFCPDAYGLSSFSYPTLEKRLRKKSTTEFQTQKRQDKDFINIRLRRNSFRNLITGTAACLIMLLLSKPAGNLPSTGNQEAFLMHDYISAPKDDDTTVNNDPFPELKPKIEVVEAIPEQVEFQDQIVEPVKETKKASPKASKKKTEKTTTVEETIAPEKFNRGGVLQQDQDSRKEKTKVLKNSAKESSHSYYIIIGSFPEKQLAKDWIKGQSHSSVFKYSGIIESDGRARVYARSFPDKDVAQAYLNQFRSNNPDYATAWLLSVKK